jgi:hypothetical protein
VSKPFKVGDIAKLVNLNVFTEYEGTQCVIMEPIGMRRVTNTETMLTSDVVCYMVNTYDGRRLAARPFQLVPPTTTPTKVREAEEVM